MLFSTRHRYAYMLALGAYSFVNVLFMEALDFYHLPVGRGWVLGVFLVSVALIWEGNRLVEQRLPQLQQWAGGRVHPMALAFGLSLPVTLLAVGGPAWLVGRVLAPLPPAKLALGLKLMLAVGFRINLFLNTLNLIFYYLQELRRSQVEAEQLKKSNLQAQFQSLKDQVNPHFLFNNLNVLAALLYQNADQAADFIQQLSKVYRYVLQHQDKELVDVGAELEFMESYVYLLRARFRDSLVIDIDVPDTLRGLYTVPAALQMLLENALKHNVSSRSRPLHIAVYATDDGQLAVRNALQPKAAVEPSTQLGLANISRRYDFVSRRPVQVLRDAATFTVLLPLIDLATD